LSSFPSCNLTSPHCHSSAIFIHTQRTTSTTIPSVGSHLVQPYTLQRPWVPILCQLALQHPGPVPATVPQEEFSETGCQRLTQPGKCLRSFHGRARVAPWEEDPKSEKFRGPQGSLEASEGCEWSDVQWRRSR
ncbi:hypothetical protein AB1N83_009734, partial [Pleurotus pulmonarius]